jgi:hypothetical protein
LQVDEDQEEIGPTVPKPPQPHRRGPVGPQLSADFVPHHIKYAREYAIMGLTEETFDGKTLKQAFRRLSLAHHPDKNRSDPEAPARFQQLEQAYRVLCGNVPELRSEGQADFVGPLAMADNVDLTELDEAQARVEYDEYVELMKAQQEAALKAANPQREEWMTVLPEEKSKMEVLMSSENPLMARGFSRASKGDEPVRDQTWAKKPKRTV